MKVRLKLTRRDLLRFFLVLAMALASLLAVSPAPVVAAVTVDLQLEPAGDATPPLQATVAVGSTFSVVVRVYPNGQQVSGIAAYVHFVTTYLEVTNLVAATTPLTLDLGSSYDNVAGTMDCARGQLTGTPPSTTFTLATITFRAKAVTPGTAGTTISFDTAFPRETSAAWGEGPVTRNLTGATVTVVVPPPVAAFHASATTVAAGTPVTFYDDSTNTPTSWAWDFDNNGTTDSTAQNPTYTYTAAGTYTVKLTASNSGGSDDETKTGYIRVPGALHHINITPANPSLAVIQQQAFSAQGYDQYNTPISGLTFSWSVSDATAGSITSSGVFTAGTVAGSYADVIRAQSGSIIGSTGVTVTPGALHHINIAPANPSVIASQQQAFSAQGYDQYDNPRSGDTFTWSVTNPTAGSITSAGVFTAGTVAGSYANVVRAQSGSAIGYTGVIITPAPLHHIVISPSQPSVPTGGNQTFTAQGYDQYNNLRSTDVFTWSVTNATAGSINATTGALTAGTTPGSYNNAVQATSGGVSATASVTVTPGALHHIAVTPAHPTVAKGRTQTFSAQGL